MCCSFSICIEWLDWSRLHSFVRRSSMATVRPRKLIEVRYEAAAQEYLRNLPPEHFMEAIGQSTQRKITVESLDLVAAQRPDFHVFSELLVQYERPGERKLGQVCPDNMVVLSDKPIRA